MIRFLFAALLLAGCVSAGAVRADVNGCHWTQEQYQKGPTSPPLTCEYTLTKDAPRYFLATMTVYWTNPLFGNVAYAGDTVTIDTHDPQQAAVNWGVYNDMPPGDYFAEISGPNNVAFLYFTITAPLPPPPPPGGPGAAPLRQ